MKHVGYKNISDHYDVVNIGSGPSLYNFDWGGIDMVKGFNFAVSPEDFRYDKRVLHNFLGYIKPNGTVIIVVCPLSFAENKYLLSDYYSYRYVDILPQEEVLLSERKYKAYKNVVGRVFIDNYYRMRAIPQLVKDFAQKRQNVQLTPEHRLVEGWLKDNPYLKNLKDLPECDLTDVFNQKTKELEEIIDECINSKLRPVILIPPMSNRLRAFFSREFLNTFVYDNVNIFSDRATVIDFLYDDKYGNDDLYLNGLFLKHDVASCFTKDVLKRLDISY